MSKYATPGVYFEPVGTTVSNLIDPLNPTVCAFVGTSQRGKLNTVERVTSWSNFIEKFAEGLSTPFYSESDLAIAVYGFFQNGGTECHIARVGNSKFKKATAKDSASTFTATARDEGAWGNKVTVSVTASASGSGKDITVKYDGTIVEKYVNIVDYSVNPKRCYEEVINPNSKYIELSGTLTACELTLAGGADSTVATADYKSAFELFDADTSIRFMAIPAITDSETVLALSNYCANRGDVIAVLDPPKANVVSATGYADGATASTALISSITDKKNPYTILLTAWGKIKDPNSPIASRTRYCPPCGHVLGAIVRQIASKGVWISPSGIDANVIGFLDISVHYTNEQVGKLNDAGIIPLVQKPNVGIVLWGARVLSFTSDDPEFDYLNEVCLNIQVKKALNEAVQGFIFKPNNEETWNGIKVACEEKLNEFYMAGAFKGETASSAFYCKCDKDLNTDSVINEGKVVAEVGYATSKPAEFVVIQISHDLQSA